MKELFVSKDFRAASLNTISLCNDIIEQYQAQNLRLTLRQLYYQLVTRNAIVNQERSYKNLGNLISDGRLAGLIDWDAIEDRVRIPRKHAEWSDIGLLINSAVYSYRLPRWQGQDNYVELWVEKDAISGVLSPMADKFHVTLMVNRGYSSQSAMYEAAQRFMDDHDDQECHLLYLGDHDPSGEDMVRDIQERLDMFGASVNVKKIALTMEQVKEYQPPPNPTKMTDSRSNAYVAEHGAQCWEVDALPPEVLHELVETHILEYLDEDKMDEIKRKEQEDITKLKEYVKNIDKR